METKNFLNAIELGIGTWQWGDNILWGYGQGYADADIRAAFDACLAAGANFFDTAEVYGFGRSEKFLGRFIKESKQPVRVATKFAPLPWRLGKGSLRQALSGSLRRLDMPAVDLYQIHWPFPLVPIETWMEALADAAAAGQARAVGVSNYNVAQMRRAHAALAARGVRLVSNQVEYSLLQRGPEKSGLLALCKELDVRLIAYSPLGKGMLSGKYTPENPPPGGRSRIYTRQRLAQIQPLVALLKQYGAAHDGKTPGQVALNWLICKGALPIPGVKNARQAQQNIGATGWQLTQAEVAALDALSDGL